MADQAAPPPTSALKRPPRAPDDSPLSIGPLQYVTRAAEFFGDVAALAARTAREVARRGVNPKDLIAQMAAIGVDSIWIVLVITVATGAVFSYYTASLAVQIGFTRFVGGTLAYAFLNELGPVLGGVAFAARAGSAIAAEIGTMVVTEQVDALRAMAVSPIRYLVVPRVLASVVMLPLLIVIADFAGLAGGYYSAASNGVPQAAFLDSIYEYARVEDLTRGLIKSVFFAFIVSLVACQQGLNTRGGASGVGRSTTNSVVLCVILIFIADVFLTQILSGTIKRR